MVRSTESQVKTRTNMNPARRLVDDALAVVRDKDVPDDVQRRVAPSLFRMALEEAAKQAYFARQSRAGRSRVESEDNWQSAKKTRSRLALAVLGDSKQMSPNGLRPNPGGSEPSTSVTPACTVRGM